MGNLVNIVLVGNPNSGKSSLFNVLTGLNQKVGNFPGVTVDKKTGTAQLSQSFAANIIDLPGTYSLYPKRMDEWVAYRVLMQQDDAIKPDMVLLVADASNLKRNLLFCSQIIDLKIPVVVALTMMDINLAKGNQVDIPGLERELGVSIVAVNPRKNKGILPLKKVLEFTAGNLSKTPARDFINSRLLAPAAVDALQHIFPGASDYAALHYLINHEHFILAEGEQAAIDAIDVVGLAKVDDGGASNATRTGVGRSSVNLT